MKKESYSLSYIEVQSIVKKAGGSLLYCPPHIQNLSYHSVVIDSRKVTEGSLYIAIRGSQYDGHTFFPDVCEKGVYGCIGTDRSWKEWFESHQVGACYWIVPEPRKIASKLARSLYAHALQRLRIIAVTGTKGKTTIVHWLTHALREMGIPTARVGTLGVDPPFTPWSGLTTPESPDLASYAAHLAENDYLFLCLEASSIGLDQFRLDSLPIHTAIFTNLGHDHLDYHVTMDRYFEAKRRLFSPEPWKLRRAIINVDDPWGQKLYESCAHEPFLVRTYGYHKENGKRYDIYGSNIRIHFPTVEGVLRGRHLLRPLSWSYSPGLSFTATNFIAVFTALFEFFPAGKHKELLQVLSTFPGVPGRLETYYLPRGALAIVDYAHTPESLEYLLGEIRQQFKGNLYLVFGCGGDRDREKRPIMGEVAARYADYVYITDDNPRTEDPESIAREIILGIERAEKKHIQAWTRVPDRESAIREALERAQPNDVVIIAGKGHETYQIYGHKKIPYSDRAVVKAWLEETSS